MEELGYGKQPYIVFKHNDIAREHIHIVSLRVDGEERKSTTGLKAKSKKITDALERKYNLIRVQRLVKSGNRNAQGGYLKGNIRSRSQVLSAWF